jgi:hypothetical protein
MGCMAARRSWRWASQMVAAMTAMTSTKPAMAAHGRSMPSDCKLL